MLLFCSSTFPLAATSKARLVFKHTDTDREVTVCTESTEQAVLKELKVQAEIRILELTEGY